MDQPEWCRQCNKTTRHFDTPEGPKRCQACHPLSHQPLAQFKDCRICLAPVYHWEMRAHLSDIHGITGE